MDEIKTNITHQQWAIGVDIGGTSTKFGLVNHRGEISYAGKLLVTGRFEEPGIFVSALHEALLLAVANIGPENLKGIGIGAPNGNIHNGCIEHAPNLPWKGVVPLADMMTQKFQLPCKLTNDANAAAAGEMMYGIARGMKDFIMLTLGTGVGSAIVSNGHIIYGHRGLAGELGHTSIRRGRLHWSTGLDGSLESYASATGIAHTARLFLEGEPTSSLLKSCRQEDITAQLICESALKGDKLAMKVFQYTGQILGEAIANFVMFSDPQAIILFGGVTKAGQLLLGPVAEHMEKNLLRVFRDTTKILLSELPDADAAILGASALVWDNTNK